MRSIYLAGWAITRVIFLAFYYPMVAIGTMNVWLKERWETG